MRLPQDRILHIGTELKDGKVNIVAEWQGELVRCKDCKHSEKSEANKYFTTCKLNGAPTFVDNFCSFGERSEND